MNLVELMEVWRLKTAKTNNIDYLLEIFEDANVDGRLDRQALALEILKECGTQTPRFFDTSFFALMAVNFFTIKAREIKRDLDVLEADYDPLEQFNVERGGWRHSRDKNDNTNTRTDNLTEKFEQGAIRDNYYVSADNETEAQFRNRTVRDTDDDYTRNTGTQTHVDDGLRIVQDSHHEDEHGRHEAAQRLLRDEFEANKINLYHQIALDFSLNMMLCVD